MCANGSLTVRRQRCRHLLFPQYDYNHSWQNFPNNLYAIVRFFILLFCLSNRLRAFVCLTRYQPSTSWAFSGYRSLLSKKNLLCVQDLEAASYPREWDSVHPLTAKPISTSLVSCHWLFNVFFLFFDYFIPFYWFVYFIIYFFFTAWLSSCPSSALLRFSSWWTYILFLSRLNKWVLHEEGVSANFIGQG